MKKILVLSSSMFTDRMIRYSSFLPSIIEKDVELVIWAASYESQPAVWKGIKASVGLFPAIGNFREGWNLLRRFNEYLWAYKLNAASILSMLYFNNSQKRMSLLNQFLLGLAKCFRRTSLNEWFEKSLLKQLNKSRRSEEARERLKELAPDLILITNPFWMHESAIGIEANKLKIPIVSLIPSWDNITTKSRLTFQSKAFLVWSELRKQELHHYYPYTKKQAVHIIGTPQYDVFFQKEFEIPKEQFFEEQGWNLEKPVVVYALGSPNFLYTEYEGVIRFAKLFEAQNLHEHCQLVVRPHPNKDNNELTELLKDFKGVIVQSTSQANKSTERRTQGKSDICRWVNTFRYADVLINLSSTVIFDALFFGKEVINIDFDPGEKGTLQSFIKEINKDWVHLNPLYKHPAIYQAQSFEDIINRLNKILIEDVKTSLEDKNRLVELICGFYDGKSGTRMADAIIRELNKVVAF